MKGKAVSLLIASEIKRVQRYSNIAHRNGGATYHELENLIAHLVKYVGLGPERVGLLCGFSTTEFSSTTEDVS